MKRLGLACLALVFAVLLAPAQAAEATSLAPLKAWVGKYPSEKIDGRDVWGVGDLRKKTEALLGPDYSKTLFEDFQISFPVQVSGDVVHFSFCKPHECLGVGAYFFVDVKEQTVDVCWRRKEENPYDLWFSPGKGPRVIGPGECLDVYLGATPFTLYEKEKATK